MGMAETVVAKAALATLDSKNEIAQRNNTEQLPSCQAQKQLGCSHHAHRMLATTPHTWADIVKDQNMRATHHQKGLRAKHRYG